MGQPQESGLRQFPQLPAQALPEDSAGGQAEGVIAASISDNADRADLLLLGGQGLLEVLQEGQPLERALAHKQGLNQGVPPHQQQGDFDGVAGPRNFQQ